MVVAPRSALVLSGLLAISTGVMADAVVNDTSLTYFGDDFPMSCNATCTPFVSAMNVCGNIANNTAAQACVCTSDIGKDMSTCGDCVLAGVSPNSTSGTAVEMAAVLFAAECNISISIKGADANTSAALSVLDSSIAATPVASSTSKSSSSSSASSAGSGAASAGSAKTTWGVVGAVLVGFAVIAF